MSKIKICLDAGHFGKFNRSPAVPAYYESDMNWTLHLLLKKHLEQLGCEVITTREKKEKDMDLVPRGEVAKGCDLFLSIHANAADNPEADYPLVIVPISGSVDALGNDLAKCIEGIMGTKQNAQVWKKEGKKGYDWYGVIRGASYVGVPGIILEHSFYTNRKMAMWLMNKANLDKLAQAEAKVIAAYLGAEKPTEETTTKEENKVDIEVTVLKKGAKGENVKALQALLVGYGYKMTSADGKTAYGVDGSFGGATDRAVKAFQKDKGLAVDGSVGRATWTSLLGL